jgi:hypothetical protein
VTRNLEIIFTPKSARPKDAQRACRESLDLGEGKRQPPGPPASHDAPCSQPYAMQAFLPCPAGGGAVRDRSGSAPFPNAVVPAGRLPATGSPRPFWGRQSALSAATFRRVRALPFRTSSVTNSRERVPRTVRHRPIRRCLLETTSAAPRFAARDRRKACASRSPNRRGFRGSRPYTEGHGR